VLIASSILWALYEVLIKKIMPKASQADINVFVGFRGLSNLLLVWPMILAFQLTG
jgi:drug/metabolite transporter (DMT)-like permease